MQPHHKVTLSYLWHFVQQFFYFVKCDRKHSDDQRIVEDDYTCYVDLTIIETSYEVQDYHEYEHAVDGK
jgi:hypothetical protein